MGKISRLLGGLEKLCEPNQSNNHRKYGDMQIRHGVTPTNTAVNKPKQWWKTCRGTNYRVVKKTGYYH